jgi:hypothetical protein
MLRKVMWQFLGYGAVSLRQYNRILRVRTSSTNAIPISIRIKIVRHTAHALVAVRRLKEGLAKLDEAYELSKQIHPEYSINTALTSLDRCDIFIELGEYDKARHIAVSYLEYFEKAGSSSRVVSVALTILAQI